MDIVKVSTLQSEFMVEVEMQGSSVNTTTGKLNSVPFELSVVNNGEKQFHLIRNNRSYRVEVLKVSFEEKQFVIRVNGMQIRLNLKDRFDLLMEEMGFSDIAGKKVNELRSPMPGLVLDIPAQEGVEVKKGDPLIILEAMKMENVLKSPADAIIKKIMVRKGTPVEKNEVLVQFE